MHEYLRKTFFKYIIPTILSLLAFSLYTMVDGIFVARGVGETALAAVNLSLPYNSAMFASGLLLAVGMGTVIAIRMGEGDAETANQLFTQNLLISAGISVIISIVTLIFLEPISFFLGAADSTLFYVKEYIGVISPFAVFFICSYNMEILVKTDGTPHLAAIGVILAGVTNIILDWLFVIKFSWGVKGAALATGLAQAVSAILYISYFWNRSNYLKFTHFRWNVKIYKETIPLGIADSITELSNGIVLFLFNRTILGLLGEDGIVCYTIIGYVNTLMLMIMSGIAQGIQPLCSYYYGKRDRKSYEYIFRLGLWTAAGLGMAGFLFCTFWGRNIVFLFIESENSLYWLSVKALGQYSWGFLCMGLNVVSAAFFTSIQKGMNAFAISIGRGLMFPVISLVLLPMWLGKENIWFAGTTSEGLCLVLNICLMYIYFYKVALNT